MQDEIRQLERKRKGFMVWEITGWLILLASGVWGLLYWLQDRRIEGALIGIILFLFPYMLFALLGTAVGIDRRKEKYRGFYKRIFVESALKKRFTDVSYQQDWGIGEERIADTEMIPIGNTCLGTGYIDGRYKGVLFEQSNLWIGVRRSRHHDTTYFDGRWMILKFPKPFKTDVQVKERGFAHARKSGGLFHFRPKRRRQETGNLEFDEQFQVYAANELEANRILTARTREAIQWLTAKYEGKIMFGFMDRELHIAIRSRKSAFEAPIYQKIIPEQVMQAVEEEIDIIIQFIEEFT